MEHNAPTCLAHSQTSTNAASSEAPQPLLNDEDGPEPFRGCSQADELDDILAEADRLAEERREEFFGGEWG